MPCLFLQPRNLTARNCFCVLLHEQICQFFFVIKNFTSTSVLILSFYRIYSILHNIFIYLWKVHAALGHFSYLLLFLRHGLFCTKLWVLVCISFKSLTWCWPRCCLIFFLLTPAIVRWVGLKMTQNNLVGFKAGGILNLDSPRPTSTMNACWLRYKNWACICYLVLLPGNT